MKLYDRAYFQRWYHQPTTRVVSPRVLERKVRLALAAAEYLLSRRVASVLDVGCGEAPWYAVLRRLRRGIVYQGVDASEYVVQRYGKRRNIRSGTFGGLRDLRLAPGWDLIVCSDVLQYVPSAQLPRGLREIRRLLGGVAFIEAYAQEDAMEGDMEDWHVRPAAEYRRLFRRAGLAHCGLSCFIDPRKLAGVNALEMC